MAEETDTIEVEATGETVGEAKWSALRELERRVPGVDKSSVRFVVVSEGERGLLGVGYAPARVLASVAAAAAPPPPAADESPLARRSREVVDRVASELGARSRVETEEDDEHVVVTCSGGDLGVLIGRHGHTIDAIQYLVNAIVRRDAPAAKDVVVDAAGYRERRRAALEALAVRAAERAIDTRERVELEPMTAVERKIVHLRLRDVAGVETSSEGTEPNRHVVITPA